MCRIVASEGAAELGFMAGPSVRRGRHRAALAIEQVEGVWRDVQPDRVARAKRGARVLARDDLHALGLVANLRVIQRVGAKR